MARTKTGLKRVQRIRKRVLAVGVFLGLTTALVTGSPWSADSAMRPTLNVVGLLLILTCILGRTWCMLYIAGRKTDELVERGPYSIVRNPLYIFSAFGAAGIGASLGSLVLAGGAAVACLVVFTVVVHREEFELTVARGEPYAHYLTRVPRFLPDFRLWHDDEELTISPWPVTRTALDALAFLLAFPYHAAIEFAQNLGFLPVLLRLP